MKAPKKRSIEDLAEIKRLRDWCVAVLAFFNEVEPAGIFAQMKLAVEKAFDSQDLRGLRLVARDLLSDAGRMTEAQKESLDRRLESLLGIGLKSEFVSERVMLRTIVDRSSIETADEYRLLADRADEIHSDPSKKYELEKINALLLGSKRFASED